MTRRGLLVLVLIVSLLLSFTSCSKNRETESKVTTAVATPNVTTTSQVKEVWSISDGVNLVKPDIYGNPAATNEITFWVYRTLGPSSNYPRTAEMMSERIESWARKNPDTKVIVQNEIPQEKTNEYMVKLYEAAKAGKAPSIAHVDSFFLPKFLEKDAGLKQVPQPMNPYLTQQELNNYYDSLREFSTDDNGNMIGHFGYTDVRVLWYRKDLMDAPPKTWDELITITKKLQAEGKVTEGLLTQGGRHENTFFFFVNMFWAAGGNLVDSQGKPIFNDGKNREIMLDTLRLYDRLVKEGIMPKKVASIAGTGDLNAGVKMTMPPFILTGHWIHGSLPQVIGEEAFANYEMALIPTLEPGQRPVSGAGGWTTVIFEDDPKLKAKTFDFLWEVYGDVKGMAAVAVDALPTFKDVATEWRPVEANPYLYKATQMLEYARIRPAAAIYSDISLAMQVAIGDVILGQKTPEKALDDAWKEVESLMR